MRLIATVGETGMRCLWRFDYFSYNKQVNPFIGFTTQRKKLGKRCAIYIRIV